jgi:hypothetical protein
MARNRRPRDQPVVALLSLMLVALSLLIQPGYSLSIAKFPDSPSSATPNGADIAKNCEMILTSMRMRVSLSNMSPNNKLYRVRLKVFTTHADTLDILKMPSLQGVVPRTIYNKEKNRGFTANITDEQICELYQLPTVTSMSCKYVFTRS